MSPRQAKQAIRVAQHPSRALARRADGRSTRSGMLSKGSRPSEKPHAGKDVVSPSVTLREAGIDGNLPIAPCRLGSPTFAGNAQQCSESGSNINATQTPAGQGA